MPLDETALAVDECVCMVPILCVLPPSVPSIGSTSNNKVDAKDEEVNKWTETFQFWEKMLDKLGQKLAS